MKCLFQRTADLAGEVVAGPAENGRRIAPRPAQRFVRWQLRHTPCHSATALCGQVALCQCGFGRRVSSDTRVTTLLCYRRQTINCPVHFVFSDSRISLALVYSFNASSSSGCSAARISILLPSRLFFCIITVPAGTTG